MPPYDAIDMDDEAAPDVLFIRNRGRASTLEFPAYAIGDGILTVGTVREAAAHALDVAPARRVKLLYKGRLLKDDGVSAKSVGLKQNSQLMCVVSADFGAEGSESERDGRRLTADEMRRRHSSRRGRRVYDDEDDNNRGRREPEYLAEPRRHGRRHRSSSSPPRGHRLSSAGPGPARPRAPSTNLSPSMAAAGGGGGGAGRRASSRPPSSSSAARSPSRPPSRPKPSPLAPLSAAHFNAARTSHDKIDVLEHYFATVIEPACLEYMDNPPRDPKTKDFEHKRISETVMTQLFLKADGISIDGDEMVRQRRKALIDRVHGLLQEVDDSATR